MRPGPSGFQTWVVGSNPSVTVTEHKQLFSRYTTANRARNTFVYTGKGKRPATCTLKFVCLANSDAEKPQSSIKERTILCNAGLGEKSVQLDANANQAECHEEITKHFPQLGETGYEVLLYQRGEDGGFFKIDPPYIPKRIKDIAGNAKIYLRPLQRNLIADSSGIESEVSIKHMQCQLSVPVVSASCQCQLSLPVFVRPVFEAAVLYEPRSGDLIRQNKTKKSKTSGTRIMLAQFRA